MKREFLNETEEQEVLNEQKPVVALREDEIEIFEEVEMPADEIAKQGPTANKVWASIGLATWAMGVPTTAVPPPEIQAP
ncbi:MAG: hypothetical protein IKD28_01690, partial [Clostridia bacterium]|nr:hypothetical protein [Clostridia bacterium]